MSGSDRIRIFDFASSIPLSPRSEDDSVIGPDFIPRFDLPFFSPPSPSVLCFQNVFSRPAAGRNSNSSIRIEL
ncbi:hypothetical protein CH375_01195 [Leptospira ellisii]|nr:hypothetical protein CH375_01195 [Leptospira ellisii]